MKTLACTPGRPGDYLTGGLSPQDEREFVAHLDGCDGCRAALEAAAGDPGSWREARALLAAPPPAFDPATGLPADLAFLAPTDDPASLGRIGTYEITGLIGRGGMGAVFKALDPPLGRTVAVKAIDPALAADPAVRARFAREAKAMAAVSHPHVVPVYAVDEHRVPGSVPPKTLPYFVMEYVPGETLAGRLARTGPLPVLAAVRVARQIALGLAAAHEQGLIHRDVKPANVLLERGVERVRVADFGLARAADGGFGGDPDATGLTRTGVAAGTPEYMAPEQVRGERCDGRADLFALGAVLHASLTGASPFRGGSLYDVLRRVVEEPAEDLRAAAPRVPVWLAAFVGKLLSKSPADRFSSAADVADRLAAELNALENPGARPPARDYLPPRRRPLRLAAGFAAVAGLCALALWPRSAPIAPEPDPLAPEINPPTLAQPPKPRHGGASALGDDPDLPTDAALDAQLATAAAAAAALDRDLTAPPPAADAWRDLMNAAQSDADRLMRELNDDPLPPTRARQDAGSPAPPAPENPTPTGPTP